MKSVSSLNLNVDIEFKTLQCARCDMVFATTARFMKARRNDHDNFYCPAGHSNHYPQESKSEILARQLLEARRDISIERDNVRRLEYQRRAEKAAKTRLKNRIAAGVCPCCNRTFKQLAAHMKNKHPEYSAPQSVKD